MDAGDLSELFHTMKKTYCLDEGVWGDGDPRMRKFQKQTYTKVSNEFAWMEKLDFPIRFGLNSDGGPDFPWSDALHMLKKLRNNSKYLSTRLLLFANPANITVSNRLKWSARWECVIQLWHDDEDFRDAISKSAIGCRTSRIRA